MVHPVDTNGPSETLTTLARRIYVLHGNNMNKAPKFIAMGMFEALKGYRGAPGWEEVEASVAFLSEYIPLLKHQPSAQVGTDLRKRIGTIDDMLDDQTTSEIFPKLHALVHSSPLSGSVFRDAGTGIYTVLNELPEPKASTVQQRMNKEYEAIVHYLTR